MKQTRRSFSATLPTMEVREYKTSDGRSPFAEWMRALRSSDARGRINGRLVRLQAGNRGDWRAVGAGVFELRIDCGPGYRIYCGQDGETLVLLLCAGDKSTQPNDIERAHEYWTDYQQRR